MSLLHELAITPDVFRQDGYTGAGSCATSLAFLRPILMEEAVVRDLRRGRWSGFILGEDRGWHPAGRELVKKLLGKARLLPAEPANADEPSTDLDWAEEAIKSHGQAPLAAVLVGKDVYSALPKESLVCSVEKPQLSDWWRTRGCSLRLNRRSSDYLAVLGLALRHANVLRFIDPHLDPSRRRYGEFGRLLSAARRSGLAPLIELHRVCYDGSGSKRNLFKSVTEIQGRFTTLDAGLAAAGLRATVYVWDDFHDRYFISNLVGVSTPNGFDISGNEAERTTWTRLSTRDREDVEREFDKAAHHHELRFQFSVGARV